MISSRLKRITRFLQISIFVLTSLLFSACSDIDYIPESSVDDNSTLPGTNLQRGHFFDAYVNGLIYVCSSNETNTTVDDGNFTCPINTNVTFYLGANLIGTIPMQNGIVTPYTIFPDNIVSALNLSRLIQSIDSDSNLSNEIIMIDDTLVALLPSPLDFNSISFESDIETALGIELVSANDAQRRMNEALADINASNEVPAGLILPIANVGVDFNASINSFVTLDGSSSIGDNFRWTLLSPSGSESNISTDKNTSFLASSVGVYKATLTVNGSDINFAIDSVNITIPSLTIVVPPVVNAGNDFNTTVDTNVSLGGADSFGNTYLWSVVSQTDSNATVNITNTTDKNPIFSADKAGVYTLELLVNSGEDDNVSDTVVITLKDIVIAPAVPTILNSIGFIDENTATNTLVGSINVTSSGDSNITSYTLSGTGSENFTVNADGEIYSAAIFDYEVTSIFNLSVYATNALGDSTAKTLIINVNNLPDVVPTIVDTALVVKEDATVNDIVGQLTITSAGDTAITSVSLAGAVATVANYSIDINGTIRVKTNTPFDYETTTQYTLTAVATNAAGNSNNATLTVYINNVVDEIAIIEDLNATVDENAANGVVVGNVNIADTGDSSITAITLSGNGSENFDITTAGVLTLNAANPLDFESVSSYLFSAVATNGAGDSLPIDINVSIIDVPEVAILSDVNLTILETKVAPYSLGSVGITYGGDSNITAMALAGTGSTDFTISTAGEIFLAADVVLDYETTAEYNLTAMATNGAGSSTAVDIHIAVEDYIYSPFQIAKIAANDAVANDTFGSTVDVDGEYIVVGAPKKYANTNTSEGSVYVYKKDINGTLTQIATLTESAVPAFGEYGTSVAISGNFIVVGAPSPSIVAPGSIYVYEIDSTADTIPAGQLLQGSTVAEDNFGISVAIDGAYIVVGADTESSNDGSVYLFKITASVAAQTDVITLGIADSSDQFGSSVAIDGDFIVVGAYGENMDTGAAYIYEINSGTDTVGAPIQITADDGVQDDYFGAAVAISGNYIVVGAEADTNTYDKQGSAYLFGIDGDQKDKFESSSIGAFEHFGNSVAIDSTYIAIGAYEDDGMGSAEVFQIDTDDNSTSLVQRLDVSDIQSGDKFGSSVALNGDYIIVGASGEDSRASNGGSVYIYDAEPVSRVYLYNAEDSTVSTDEGSSETLFDIDAASPDGAISYTLSGDDASDFTLSSSIVSGLNVFDYELPTDFNTNNQYNFTVTMTDILAQELDLNLEVGVDNRYFLDFAKVEPSNEAPLDVNLTDDRFGEVVANSGNYIVVGSPYDNTSGTNAGSVYVYKKGTDSVTQIAVLQASDAEADAYFGGSISVDGNKIAVGAYKDDSSGADSGSAYVFKINITDDSVDEVVKVVAPAGSSGDNFGNSIGISGNYLVVGAENESNGGSAYLFEIGDSNISSALQFTASDIEVGDNFASSIAIDGNYVIVGAKNEDTNATDNGAAYLYEIVSNASVTQEAIIYPSTVGISDDDFGESVDVDVDASDVYIVIGASKQDNGGQANSGSAYFYKYDTLIDTLSVPQKIVASDADASDNFGISVSIDGDNLVVGKVYQAGLASSGAAYIFEINKTTDTATEIEKLTSSSGAFDSFYGSAVSISGDDIVVGDYKEDTLATDAGGAYIYTRD